MNNTAMEPHDHALWDMYNGDPSTNIIVHRDDGLVSNLEMDIFFRKPDKLSDIEIKALELCKGNVLDAGAGTGTHSLILQECGFSVLAIDVAPHAVEIMKARGIRDAQCLNVFDLHETEFDSILMLMHGIGLVETLDGLDNFLVHAKTLLKPDGLLIFDSLDVRCTTEAVHLQYQDANRKASRYFGEIRSQFEYKGRKGDFFSWLHVDPGTLKIHASRLGWESKIEHQEPDGNYLVSLTRRA